MAGRIFIHIGTSKTGTTSIQRTMSREAGYLRRTHSVNYPRTNSNHMVLALPFLGGQEFRPIQNHILRGYATQRELDAAADRLLRDIKRDAARYDTHVLSSEQLEGLNAASLERLKRFLDGLGLAISIIVYVRHPAERFSSLVSQRVRSGRFSIGTVSTEDEVLPMLKTYVRVFGKENVIVRRFGARYWPNERLIDDFTSVFHGTPIEGMTELKANESLSGPAVFIADRLFDIAPLLSGSRGDESWLHRIAGPKFLAPRALVEKAVENSRGCLEYLEREFGVVFHEVDLSQFPEAVPSGLPPEAIDSLVALLNEQSRTLNSRRPMRLWSRPSLVKRLRQRIAWA